MTTENVRMVGIIANEIRDAVLALAPNAPTQDEYECITAIVVANHQYKVVQHGRDINGERYVHVEPLDAISTQEPRPREYGFQHPSGVVVETPELFQRMRKLLAEPVGCEICRCYSECEECQSTTYEDGKQPIYNCDCQLEDGSIDCICQHKE